MFDCAAVDDVDLNDPLIHAPGRPCHYCGQTAYWELVEVWDDHNFQLDGCCSGLIDELMEAAAASPEEALSILRAVGIDHVVCDELRRVVLSENGSWLLDYQLSIRPIKQGAAKDFIRTHHRHIGEHAPLDANGRPYNKPPAGWKFGAGIYNGFTLVGIVWVGRPVNRVLQSRGWLEVNRLCIDNTLPREITWKACSMAYGWAKREAKRCGAVQLCTYTLEEEVGMTLRYAHWTPDHKTQGGTWDTPSRRRLNVSTTARKIRWIAWKLKAAAVDQQAAGGQIKQRSPSHATSRPAKTHGSAAA